MAFARRSGGAGGFKKKSGFTRLGGMLKSRPEWLHENAEYSYATNVGGEYLEKALEAMTKVYEAGGAVRFSLTKWKSNDPNDPKDKDPVLSVSEYKSNGSAVGGSTGSKRIGRGAEQVVEAQDVGL